MALDSQPRTASRPDEPSFPGLSPELPLTAEQRQILLWAYRAQQRGTIAHLLIQAYAGSGKTTTLQWLAEMLSAMDPTLKITAIVFNKHNAVTLKEKLPASVYVATTHALGRSAITRFLGREKRLDQQSGKYPALARAAVERRLEAADVDPSDSLAAELAALDEQERGDLVRGLGKLVEMAMLTRTVTIKGRVAQADEAALYQMALLYDCDTDAAELLGEMVAPIVTEGLQLLLREGVIDFPDMLFVPASLPEVGRCVPYAHFVLTDEAQDLNRCQHELARLARGKLGRVVAVGDRYQSIMMFAGADSGGMDRLQGMLSMDELPLSVCWRCPASHIAEAQAIVPGIQARPGAPAGTIVRDLEVEQMLDNLRPSPEGGDLVLCRMTAPLLDVAWQAIQEGITVDFRGRAIGDSILALIKKVLGKAKRARAMTLDQFADKLDEWERKQIAKITAKDGPNMDSAIQTLSDRVHTVRTLAGRVRALHAELAADTPADPWLTVEPPTTDHLVGEIERMFANKTGPRVTFSTVHRAKGDERERVWIVAPDLLGPGKRDKTPEAVQQARNIKYVAMTRSLDWLGYVNYRQ